MTSNTFVKNVEHESAIKHVTGRAIYTDDISEPRNILHAAIGFSPVSKGCLLYTSPSPRDRSLSRMPSSA